MSAEDIKNKEVDATVEGAEEKKSEEEKKKAEAAEKKEKRKKRKRKQRRRFLIKSFVVLAVAALVYFFVVGIVPQHGNQMFPSAKDGDLVITFRLFQTYESGAVCAYKDPQGKLRLGRIVAMPGDVVSYSDKGKLLVNGMEVLETYILPYEAQEQTKAEEYQVPAGSYYVLNDYRLAKDDSRTYGAIEQKDMYGQAFWLFRRREF